MTSRKKSTNKKRKNNLIEEMREIRVVPLMELPPLSPGIQARVIEEVEVVETVKRG